MEDRRRLLSTTDNFQFEIGGDYHAALSIITNSSTSIHTLSSLLNTLILNLHNPTPQHTYHRHRIISLLHYLSRRQTDLRRDISIALRTFALLPSIPVPDLAHSLSTLFLIEDAAITAGGDGDDACVADESMFLSLCFRPLKASLRHWLLRNACWFRVRPSVLITVVLGFTNDPYPLTRKAALDVLVWLGDFVVVEDQSVVQGCYARAAELMLDAEDSVRCSAVRAVSVWGLLLVNSNHDKCKIEWSDNLFVQLLSMVRDMSMKVRREAFDAVVKVGIVSEHILLQTLSKKTSSATKEESHPGQYTIERLRLPASSAAFAFVHGLEDEFSEVRRSACFALRNLATLSADFACEAVNLLMDMLNDDSVDVRLQVLDTMHHMAMRDLLKVKEGRLHMLLGTLVDSNTLIRSAARKILQLIKLHQSSMFKSCFEGFVRNMELCPQDEADLLFTLFCFGQNHGRFVVNLIQERIEEIEPSSGGTLGFENVRTVTLLVLAISAPVSVERSICSIPPRIYSYAATLLGRICRSLAGHVKQNDLLSYLFQCSQFSFVSDLDFFRGGGGPVFSLVKRDALFCEKSNDVEGSYSHRLLELEKEKHPTADHRVEICKEMAECMNNIFQKVHDVWSLVRCGFIDEATRILRGLEKEIRALTCNSPIESTGESVFILQYLDIVETLGRIWMHFMFPLKFCFSGVGMVEVLLGHLERSLTEMMYKFVGLTSEQEVHISEMILVTYTLKVCNLKGCCMHLYLKKLSCVVANVENLVEGSSVKLSSYVIELQKALGEIGHSVDAALDKLFLLQKSLEHFYLRQFMFPGILFHMKANLDICNGHEDPLRYVSGLPVGIPCEITLCNISSKSRVWLKMSLHEKLCEFVYLDLNGFSGCDESRKFTFVAPFYGTPKATSFTLKVCIALECSREYVSRPKFHGGPKGELIKLSEEKEVYLSRMVG